MPDSEVSQNVVLAVLATPLLAAVVDLIKNFGPPWLNRGMLPALIAEVLGIVLGVLAKMLYPVLYDGAAASAPLAFYVAAGFGLGVGAVGLHAQYKAGMKADQERTARRRRSDREGGKG